MNRETDSEDKEDVLRGIVEQTTSARELIGLQNPRDDGMVSMSGEDVATTDVNGDRVDPDAALRDRAARDSDDKEEGEQDDVVANAPFVNITKEQADKAVNQLDAMIDAEKEKISEIDKKDEKDDESNEKQILKD